MTSPAKTPEKKHWLDVWHVSPSINRDYDFIDGLRGVAILMVIFGHLFYINPHSTGALEYIGAFLGTGGYGVTLFFALSGFLISWPFWKRKVAGAAATIPTGYFQRRFWKIYPPLAFSILLFTPVYIFLNNDWSYGGIAGRWLAGLPFLLPVNGKLNPVMWTLVIEVQFYITLPLAFICLKRLSARTCLWLMTGLFLFVPTGIRLASGLRATFYPDINTYYPSALDVFALGIFVAGLENLGWLKKRWAVIGVAGAILWPSSLAIAALSGLRPVSASPFTVEIIDAMLKISAGCLLFFVANPRHPIPRLLCAPWLRWCGIISYEWYLLHQPIHGWIRHAAGRAEGHFLKYITVVGGSLVVGLLLAALLYRLFSLPLLRYGREKNQPGRR